MRMKMLALAAVAAIGLSGCAAFSSGGSLGFVGDALGQVQVLPPAPASVTDTAQTALNKVKVGITFTAGAVHTAGDGMKFAASVGLLKGPNATKARIAYDDGVKYVNEANDAAAAAQAAIDAGTNPSLQSINDAIAKAKAAVAEIKGVTPGA